MCCLHLVILSVCFVLNAFGVLGCFPHQSIYGRFTDESGNNMAITILKEQFGHISSPIYTIRIAKQGESDTSGYYYSAGTDGSAVGQGFFFVDPPHDTQKIYFYYHETFGVFVQQNEEKWVRYDMEGAYDEDTTGLYRTCLIRDSWQSTSTQISEITINSGDGVFKGTASEDGTRGSITLSDGMHTFYAYPTEYKLTLDEPKETATIIWNKMPPPPLDELTFEELNSGKVIGLNVDGADNEKLIFYVDGDFVNGVVVIIVCLMIVGCGLIGYKWFSWKNNNNEFDNVDCVL